MKINSENAKRQRMIVRRMKSGKTLVGLLAGLAVGLAISGCSALGLGGATPGCPLVFFGVPEGAEMPIGEYTQLQLCDVSAYTSRCENGRCFLEISTDCEQKREEFEITEHVNRALKTAGSDGIIGDETEFEAKPEVSIWPLRENLALAVGELRIEGKVGERFSGFYLGRLALLRKR